MNQSLATFMKIALTVTVIVALLFMFGYKLIDDEIQNYEAEVINAGTATDPHGLNTDTSDTRS